MSVKPGFICTGHCDGCPVYTYRSIAMESTHPQFNTLSCSLSLSRQFNASVISQEVYDEYLDYSRNKVEDNDEHYVCLQNDKDIYTKNSLCKKCNVYGYLTDLGYIRTRGSQQNYVIFESPDGKEQVTCRDLMHRLCGVTVSHTVKYKHREKFSQIDPDYIYCITAEVTDRANHLKEVQERNDKLNDEKMRFNHERKIQLEEERKKRRADQAVAATEREHQRQLAEKRRKKREQERREKREDKYAETIRTLREYAARYSCIDPTHIDHYDFSDSRIDQYLKAKYLQLFKKLDDKGYEEFRSNFVIVKQKSFVEYTSKLLYDVEKGKLYHTIAEAPVCCGDCSNCDLAEIYGKYHQALLVNQYRTNCRNLAPNHVDEINKIFRFFRVSEIINLPYNGGLIFCNSDREIIHIIKIYLGRKFTESPISANDYFNPDL